VGERDDEPGDRDAVTSATESAPPSRPPVASRLPIASRDAYALGAEIARGGMGRIVAAEDLRVGRRVAVKELLGSDPGMAARFEREARVTARLQHPGIVPIYEIGAWADGTPFYAMRHVEGRTLREALAAAPTVGARLALLPALIAAAEAVAFAHSRGVIHRDLSPNNILVGAYGETVVIDWGLAKDLADDPAAAAAADAAAAAASQTAMSVSELTVAGAVMGTAPYMPPEQARGEAVDTRADVYALGALLYHLLAGEPPYRVHGGRTVVDKVLAGPPPPLRDGPPDLASIADKAMARSRDARYADAGALAEELRRFQTGRLVEAHAYSRGELARRWLRRHRGAVAVAVIAAVVLATVGVVLVAAIVGERDDTRAANRELLVEQGRRELLAGNPARAMPYLSAAYSAGDDAPATRFMIAMAMHEVDARVAYLAPEPGSPVRSLQLDATGARAVVERADRAELVDVATGAARVLRRGSGVRAQLSHDDRTIAVWGGDAGSGATVDLIDAASGARRTLPAGELLAVMMSDDASRVAVWGPGTLAFWDTRGPTPIRAPLPAGSAAPDQAPPEHQHLGFPVMAPDGSRVLFDSGPILLAWPYGGDAPVIVTAPRVPFPRRALSANRAATRIVSCGPTAGQVGDTVVEWDAATGTTLASHRAADGYVYACGAGSAGEVMAVGDRGDVEVWRAVGEPAVTIRAGHRAGLSEQVVDPRTLATTYLDDVQVWDSRIGIETARLETRGPIAVSRDGTRIATTTRDGGIAMSRVDPRRVVRRSALPVDGSVAVSPDGSRVVAQGKGEATLYDTDRGVALASAVILGSPPHVGGHHMLAVLLSGDLAIYDDRTGALERTIAGVRALFSLMSGDGSRAVTTSDFHTADIWDLDTGTRVSHAPVPPGLLDDGGHHMLVTGAELTMVVDVDDAVGGVARMHPLAIPAGRAPEQMVISPDGARAVITTNDLGHAQGDTSLAAQLYDLAIGRPLGPIIDNAGAVSWTGDGSVVIATRDGWLEMLDATTGAVRSRAPADRGLILAAVSPDGELSFAVDIDGDIVVRSVRDARALYRIAGFPFALNADPDTGDWSWGGSLLASETTLTAATETAALLATWDVHLETRSPAAIAAVVAERVPYRLVGGQLVDN
jgi:WD40 repeat protein